jgi:hypothetical protein
MRSTSGGRERHVTMNMAVDARSGGLWFRAHARVRAAHLSEIACAPEGADDRVVEFVRPEEGEFPLPAWTEPYSPLTDLDLLGEFVRVFAADSPPPDSEIESFYARFGAIRDSTWVERLSSDDAKELPQLTRLGLREPVWWSRELASELRVCCQLYEGVCEGRAELLRETLGLTSAVGELIDIRLLSGQVLKTVAAPEDRKRRVSSGTWWEPTSDDPGRAMTDEECLGWAQRVLRSHLNAYEARSHRQWVSRAELPWDSLRSDDPIRTQDENRLLGGFRTAIFDSLVAVMYVQLSDLAARGGLLRRCQGCQRFFFLSRPDQSYCAQRCSNAHRRRRFTARHRAQQHGDQGP